MTFHEAKVHRYLAYKELNYVELESVTFVSFYRRE